MCVCVCVYIWVQEQQDSLILTALSVHCWLRQSEKLAQHPHSVTLNTADSSNNIFQSLWSLFRNFSYRTCVKGLQIVATSCKRVYVGGRLWNSRSQCSNWYATLADASRWTYCNNVICLHIRNETRHDSIRFCVCQLPHHPAMKAVASERGESLLVCPKERQQTHYFRLFFL